MLNKIHRQDGREKKQKVRAAGHFLLRNAYISRTKLNNAIARAENSLLFRIPIVFEWHLPCSKNWCLNAVTRRSGVLRMAAFECHQSPFARPPELHLWSASCSCRRENSSFPVSLLLWLQHWYHRSKYPSWLWSLSGLSTSADTSGLPVLLCIPF